MEMNVHTYTPASLGFMQVVPGSFKPAPCNCNAKMDDRHERVCPKFFPEPNLPKIDPYVWPPVPKFLRPQPQGEQCGRCWQNHTPGFVCACSCHNGLGTGTLPPQINCGDDLDAPTTS